MNGSESEKASRAFMRACRLDVSVRKPGNVSVASPGHGMDAALFLASAEAARAPLFEAGASIGARIEAAVQATLAVAGCNTNLGIVLLCAPIAAALERRENASTKAGLRAALESVLASLDVADARAAYRAIAAARPGGLGAARAQDVHGEPSVDLRAAMALAADRDSIARQYRDAYVDLFEGGLPQRFDAASVQRVYLGCLSRWPDSHVVRKHGADVAHQVMRAARPWFERARANAPLDDDPAFASWDEALKSQSINPGTSADLTVATLMLAGILASHPGDKSRMPDGCQS